MVDVCQQHDSIFPALRVALAGTHQNCRVVVADVAEAPTRRQEVQAPSDPGSCYLTTETYTIQRLCVRSHVVPKY